SDRGRKRIINVNDYIDSPSPQTHSLVAVDLTAPFPMNSPLNIGVVGLGRLGTQYARYFTSRLPGSRLHAVMDLQPHITRAVADENGSPKAYQDFRDLVNDPELDAVVVTTPTKLHAEVVIAAAEAGKAIFCEKPLSLDLEEAERMDQAVQKAGVFFQLGFMRRFDRAYAAAK